MLSYLPSREQISISPLLDMCYGVIQIYTKLLVVWFRYVTVADPRRGADCRDVATQPK